MSVMRLNHESKGCCAKGDGPVRDLYPGLDR
jgi:hypothetical protein